MGSILKSFELAVRHTSSWTEPDVRRHVEKIQAWQMMGAIVCVLARADSVCARLGPYYARADSVCATRML